MSVHGRGLRQGVVVGTCGVDCVTAWSTVSSVLETEAVPIRCASGLIL